MDNREIILEYTGHLTFSTIGRLLTMLKYKMVEKGIKVGIYKRILSVMIEALENIYKNSDQYSNDSFILKNHIPTFSLERENGLYSIKVSNPIHNALVDKLKEKIDRVNSKTPEELKIFYRHTISNGHFTPKGGAGLGIIEMSKISGNPLVYSFDKINEEYSIYSLQINFV
jgi:Family of unknown function (DUF6272)